MQTYITSEDYLRLYTVLPENFDRLAYKASRIIDSLTYNRIIGAGFRNLTDYQQETIKECCCETVQFYDDNVDILENVLSGYGINGVSMQFNYNASITVINGCPVRKATYNKLLSTGLCYAGGWVYDLPVFGFSTLLQDANSRDTLPRGHFRGRRAAHGC